MNPTKLKRRRIFVIFCLCACIGFIHAAITLKNTRTMSLCWWWFCVRYWFRATLWLMFFDKLGGAIFPFPLKDLWIRVHTDAQRLLCVSRHTYLPKRVAHSLTLTHEHWHACSLCLRREQPKATQWDYFNNQMVGSARAVGTEIKCWFSISYAVDESILK